jgi:hypothetical protein
MASRFYLINAAVVSPPSTVKGPQWEDTSSFTSIPLSVNKSDGAITSRTNVEGVAVPSETMMLQLVSAGVSAQVISGTVNVVIGTKAFYDTSQYFWTFHAYVTQGTTDLVRGTLQTVTEESGAIAWTTTGKGNIFALNIPVNNVTAQAGDRIVIEIGYSSRATPTLAKGQTTGRVKASGPVSQIQLTFPAPPAVGSGIVVMMTGQKDSAGMNFGTCTDNKGNTYGIAIPQRRISTNGEYAIIMYYCSKVITSGGTFTITITGDGVDHCFEGVAVEITGLNGGLLSLGTISSNSPALASVNVTTGSPGNLTGLGLIASVMARFGTTPSIAVENISPPHFTQEHEELDGTWLTSIAGESDLKFVSNTTEVIRCNWIMGNSSNYAAGVASFVRTSAVPGFGEIFYGAPAGSTDLAAASTAVTTNAGHVDFSQTIAFDTTEADISHSVVQVSQFIAASEVDLSHAVVQTTQPAPPPVQIAHIVQQIAYPTPPVPSQLAHSVLQIAQVVPSADSRISHAVIQIVPTSATALPDISGLYFLNYGKAQYHDSYYNSVELKIPDPTIKTAFLGE